MYLYINWWSSCTLYLLVEFMYLVFIGGVYVLCIYWRSLCTLYLLVEFMNLVFTRMPDDSYRGD